MKKLTLILLAAALLGGAVGCGPRQNQKLHGVTDNPDKPATQDPNTSPVTCGDSKWEKNEACDLGANNGKPDSGCTKTCTVVKDYTCDRTKGTCKKETSKNKCGDTTWALEEACDLGANNGKPDSGCTSECKVRDGWECSTATLSCTKKCGNGTKNEGEECDLGPNKNGKANSGCTSECKAQAGFICNDHNVCSKAPTEANTCGNGKLEPSVEIKDHPGKHEECDLGTNNGRGLGCDANCQIQDKNKFECSSTGCTIKGCGDGHIDTAKGEQCDDGKKHNLGGYGKCAANCQLAPHCGDGKIQQAHEQCDDGNNDDGDGCSSTCQLEASTKPSKDGKGNTVAPSKQCPPYGGECKDNPCGNGKLESGETCDDGNRTSGDGCSATCQKEKGWTCTGSPSTCTAGECGDGFRRGDEECDDGNIRDGDGCDRYCNIENSYICEDQASGKSACKKVVCGNAILEGDEECDLGDDNNGVSGQGCDKKCKLVSGWKWVPTTGGKGTTKRSACGDGKVEGTETCDDLNTDSGDGCDAQCHIELQPGGGNTYCPTTASGEPAPGPCHPDQGSGLASEQNTCGNGKVEGTETCDDGGRIGGDGCDANCHLEKTWSCHKNKITGELKCGAVCGDGKTLGKELGEECDDNNLNNGDGCSSTCKVEPGFTCEASGDANPSELPLTMRIRDFRNANGSNPGNSDFENDNGLIYNYTCVKAGQSDIQYGIVARTLGPDGAPVLNTEKTGALGPITDTGITCMSEDNRACAKKGGDRNHPSTDRIKCKNDLFYWWYHDDETHKHNFPVEYKLTLTKQSDNSYSYDSAQDKTNFGFFPLDGPNYDKDNKRPTAVSGYGDTKNCGNGDANGGAPGVHNYSFTSEFRQFFRYEPSQFKYNLTFRGDDDLWVFINGHLALDMGGVHKPIEKTVSLDVKPPNGITNSGPKVVMQEVQNHGKTVKYNKTYDMYEGGIYELAVFHAERKSCGSNYKITLQGFLNTATSSCSAKCGDGIRVGSEECDLGSQNGPNGGCSTECKINTGWACYDKSDGGKIKNVCEKTNCGDGIRQFPEECDTGTGDHTYCSTNCRFTHCGDGDVQPPEECDGGPTCGPRCLLAKCGNGIVEGNEECDDGNQNNNDSCTNSCKTPVCGDKIVSIGEGCDDGVNNGKYGSCTSDCTQSVGFCGDGIKNGPEQCDAGPVSPGQVKDNCTDKCQWATTCGDGKTEGPEQCDDGNKTAGDGCSPECQLENPGLFNCIQDDSGKTTCSSFG